MDNILLAIIDFDSFKEGFYFLSGILTGLIGSFMSYSRWLTQRTRKQYAAESEFKELKACYQSLQNQHTETKNVLRQLEGDVREFKGMLSVCMRYDDINGGKDND